MWSRKKSKNVTEVGLEEAIDFLARNSISELCTSRATLKDWKHYKDIYDTIKNYGIIREDLAHILLGVCVVTKTELEEEELQTLKEEIDKDIYSKYSKRLKKSNM